MRHTATVHVAMIFALAVALRNGPEESEICVQHMQLGVIGREKTICIDGLPEGIPGV